MEKPTLRRIAISTSILLSAILLNPKYIYAESFSQEAESYRAKGYEAQEKGDIDTAIEWYQKAVGLDPKYAAPHNDLGILFETKGWLDRAESEYQKAIAINPEYKDAHTNMALLYERKGELEKAAFHWMRRYKLGKPGETWTNEAITRLQKLGLIDKKESELKTAVEPALQAKSRITEQQAPTSIKKQEEKPKAKKPEAKKTEAKVKEAKPVKKIEDKKPKTSKWTRLGDSKDKKAKKPEKEKTSKETADKKIKAPPAAKRNIDKELEESLKLAEQRLREEKNTKDSKKAAVTARPAAGSSPYYSKAKDYYSKGEYSKALDEIRNGKNNFPEDRALLALEEDVKNKMKEERIEDLYSDGMTHYRQKDFDGAKKDFESILNILPE